MLILSRHAGESVMVGDEVTVTVLGVRGAQVRLGFAAPQHVAVHREEIYRGLKANRPPSAHVEEGAGKLALVRE